MGKLKPLLKTLVISQLLLVMVLLLVTRYVPTNHHIVTSTNFTDTVNGTELVPAPRLHQTGGTIIPKLNSTDSESKALNGFDNITMCAPLSNNSGNNINTTVLATTETINVPVLNMVTHHVTVASIAIGMGITTKKMKLKLWQDLSKLRIPFLSAFLVSFCKTASSGFDYRLYLAYDYTDTYFKDVHFRNQLSSVLRKYVHRNCPASSTYSIRYVECPYQGKPAWAQNDAMIAAYVEGAKYLFRVNDDTILVTKGWSERYIDVLNHYMPPNVGVVGPNHKGGNHDILTYDFVHRSHVEIFGSYYPRIFPSWYGDFWITMVYLPGRMTKAKNIVLRHTMKLGKRYVNELVPLENRLQVIDKDKRTLIRYVGIVEGPMIIPKPDRIISMVIWSDDPDWLWGVIRNAQLRPIYFPDWTLRVYVLSTHNYTTPIRVTHYHDSNKTTILDTETTLEKLRTLHVEIVHVNRSLLTPDVPPSLWNLLAVDAPGATYVLLREANMRLSERAATALESWLKSNNSHKATHCMRDHPRHSGTALVPGLWAVNTAAVKQILHGQTMQSLLQALSAKYIQNQDNSTKDTVSRIYDHMWSLFKDDSMCHDSISCADWPNSVSFPVSRSKNEFVGKLYTAFEPTATDVTSVFSSHTMCVPNE